MSELMEMKPAANALIEPVGELVARNDIEDTVRRLKTLMELPGNGVRFTGEFAVYNPLLELAAQDATAFRAVVRLVMKKRAAKHLPYSPLRALLAGETDEEREIWLKEAEGIAAEINRGYVAQMRERLRRLVKIENMTRHPSVQLKGQARLDFTSRKWSEWADRRVECLRAAAAAQPNGRLTRKQAREVVEAFRNTIDAELDAMEQLANQRRLRLA